MKIEEIYPVGQKIYKSIWTSTQQPLRTFEELQQFMNVLATNKVELKVLHDQLRIYIQNAKKDQSYNMHFNETVFPRDLESARDASKRAVDAIESIEAWYLLAEKHRTLNTLEANNWPRLQAVELLDKDIRPLCGIGYTNQFRPSYTIKTELDYIYYLLPFLKNGKQSLELYQAIFGFGYIDIPERLYLRLTDILYQSENSGLSRTESQEFADAGFTRDCISKYFEVLNTYMNKEANADLKSLYEAYINDCSEDTTIKKHLPII